MKRSVTALLFLFLTLAPLSAEEEKAAPAGTLRVGENLSYTRGTAKAKESVLEFPYRHSSNSRECWAFVVHEGKGSRIIFKADEIEGKKDKSGNLVNQDIPPEHPFQKVLDQIKLDALLNVFKEVKQQKKLDENDWQVLSAGAVVHKKFFRNSQRRYYCIVAVYDDLTKRINHPMLMSFQRSNQGPLASLVSPQGSITSAPMPANPSTNLPAHHVFTYLESRDGF